MIKIKFSKTDKYTTQFDDLRKICFPGPLNDNHDAFNDNSEFLVFTDTENELLALGRITGNPNGAFLTQTKMLGDFRNDIDTIDLCKCMVNPKFRAKYFFEILILSGLAYAFKKGKKYVNGAVVNNKLKERFTHLYFNVNYPQAILYDPYGNEKSVTPMRCDLLNSIDGIKRDLNENINKINDNGFTLDKSELLSIVL